MSHQRRDLESLLREAREPTADVPAFSRVWSSAVELRRRRRNRRRLLLAAVPLTAAAILAVILVPASVPREPAPELSELARSLSAVETPLDFLLEPPGGSLLGVEPTEVGTELSGRLITLDIEEIL